MKIKKLAALATGAVLAFLPIAALAATATNIQFENGDVTISGQGGNTVNATFRVVVPANQVIEWLQTDVIGDNLAPICTSVGGDQGLQEGTHDVTMPVKFPPNTGTYTVQVQGAGIFGGIRGVDCGDNIVLSATPFSGALRTVASSGSNSTTSGNAGSTSDIAQLTAQVMSLGKLVACIQANGTWDGTTCTPKAAAPAPMVSPACSAYTEASAGTMPGVKNDANGRLQGFLIYKGASIPLLQNNQAPYGFWGAQTESARVWFVTANHCV